MINCFLDMSQKRSRKRLFFENELKPVRNLVAKALSIIDNDSGWSFEMLTHGERIFVNKMFYNVMSLAKTYDCSSLPEEDQDLFEDFIRRYTEVVMLWKMSEKTQKTFSCCSRVLKCPHGDVYKMKNE